MITITKYSGGKDDLSKLFWIIISYFFSNFLFKKPSLSILKFSAYFQRKAH